MTTVDGADRRAAARTLAAVQLAAGLVLLVRPDDVVDALGRGPQRPPRWTVRLLGARRLVQGAVTIATPTRRVLLLGAGTDVLHAASMVGATLRWPGLRRPAALSAAASTVSAAVAASLARANDRPGPAGIRSGRATS